MHRRYIPEEIKKEYSTEKYHSNDNYIYCKIKRGMYGLNPLSPIIWTHESRRTVFCLCVDDFGVKYFNKNDAEHLINALRDYQITIDWTGKNYCGLHLNWNYDKGWVDVTMPNYVEKTLKKLNHKKPNKSVTAPHKWNMPAYSRKPQMAPIDKSPPLDDKGKKRIQQIVGSFLYYARAIDSTILPALNEISSSQAHPTENTKKKAVMLLDYLATNPTAKLRYVASDMILHVDSDAAYLIAPNAKSRIAGYYHLSDLPTKKHNKINGAIMVECRYLKHVVASAAEAETGGLFHNCQNAIYIRHLLEILGHKQVPTPMKTDNSTAAAFVKEMIRQKRSKSWDMRYH